ncbi:MAG: alginate export family protein [Candidatus Omnitrophica bacterium]|nr:alginate export family protein [Candidatus Omnitrophota bacterium]
MRFLKVLCVLALAISISGLVYAETQSVKISGDLDVKSIMRDAYNLSKRNAEPVDLRTGNQDTWQTYFMSTTEVQIDADLTDNVAAAIRLFNQRDWDVQAKSVQVSTYANEGYAPNPEEFNVDVNLAYIELKEFLYSPLTLKIGRQNLWFGKGFIVGANQRDPDGTINANEYTVMNSFDAFRATLDYDPWTIDVVMSKIWENDIQSKDDVDLYGVNVGYIFDCYNAEAETYYFLKDDRSLDNWNIKDGNTIHNWGIRGSLDPIQNWTAAAEWACQWGQYVGARMQTEKRDRSAWAIDASLECRHFTEQYAWKPKVGAEYIYYSGNKNIKDETPHSTGTYTGWDPMYRGKFDSKIREWYGRYYLTAQDINNQKPDMAQRYPDSSESNQHQVIVMGSIQPTDSLTFDCRYLNFWQQYETFHQDTSAHRDTARVQDDRYLGGEIDLEATWDYTEDVSFNMLAAWFFPGSHYYDQSNDPATDLVASVKLSF